MRIAFCGNDPWSVPALEAIAGVPELSIGLVVTNPPRPAGRGAVETPTAVAEVARARDLPLLETEGIGAGQGAAALTRLRPDVLVVVAYGQILDTATLAIPTAGALNLHFSLLPRWRGAAPVQWALIAGDAITGVTIMRMDAGLDTGPILGQLEEPIRADDDAGSLGARLASTGARLLVEILGALPRGGVPERAQDDRLATVAPRIGADQRVLDWSKPAAEIVRWVRGLAPDPGATTRFRGQPLKVLAAAEDHQGSRTDPGVIASVSERGVLVGAGAGGVRLLSVAPAGRRRMAAAAWARGARFADDERLG